MSVEVNVLWVLWIADLVESINHSVLVVGLKLNVEPEVDGGASRKGAKTVSVSHY